MPVRCLAAAVLTMFCLGCGPEVVPIAKVKGTIKFKGEPLADAAVLFAPEKGRAATGKTDSSGNYTLTTESPGDGVAVGKHQVTVSKMGPPKGMTAEAYAQLQQSAGAGTAVPPGKSVIPEKYGVLGASTLQATVEAGKENVINFDLTE